MGPALSADTSATADAAAEVPKVARPEEARRGVAGDAERLEAEAAEEESLELVKVMARVLLLRR